MSDSSARRHTDSARVGYVVKRYPRYSETFIVNEILAHEAANLPVEIFSLRPPIDTHFQDVISQVRAPVHYLPTGISKSSEFWQRLGTASSKNPRLLKCLPALLKLRSNEVVSALALADRASELGITHLHAHFATSAADAAWMAHELTGIPFTLTAHAKDIFHDQVDQELLAEKISSAKAAIAISEFNVRYLKDRHGAAADRVVRIYNGLDLQKFPYQSPRDRKPTIIAVGRLVEKKGFDVLIEACAILASQQVAFHTRIIGDGPLAAHLRDKVSGLGIDAVIEFLGPQPQDVVKRAMREAAVLTAPCVEGVDGNRDGLPTVLLESMAMGTPCVSTPVTGIPEAVIDGQTGLIVPQRDPVALANALSRLIADADLRVQLAKSARDHVERCFDIHRNSAIQRTFFGSDASSHRARTGPFPEVAVVG